MKFNHQLSTAPIDDILPLVPVIVAYAQSFLIPVDAASNTYPITFTALTQQRLTLTFTKSVVNGANISSLLFGR